MYGDQAPHLVALVAARPSLAAPVHADDTRLLEADIVHMARHEMARGVDDVLARRTRLALTDAGNGVEMAEGAARVLGDELGWDASRRAGEVETYRHTIATMHAWRVEASV